MSTQIINITSGEAPFTVVTNPISETSIFPNIGYNELQNVPSAPYTIIITDSIDCEVSLNVE